MSSARITIDLLVARTGLPREELDRWIANQWVRPDVSAGSIGFAEIDIARVRLIQELRDELDINEAAMPVVLSLLDQLYDHRRRLRALCEAIPAELRERLLK